MHFLDICVNVYTRIVSFGMVVALFQIQAEISFTISFYNFGHEFD